MNENLFRMANKTNKKFISSTFDCYNSCIVNFDLWTSRVNINIFVFNLHFLNDKCEPCHVTIGLF
jgi:hypothetical protein